MKHVFKKVAVALAVFGAAFTVGATPIIGTANLSFGLVSISAGEIDWNPPLNPGFNATATYGSFATAGGSNTGSFAVGPMAGLTAGLIQDMSSNPLDANFVPVGSNLGTPKYLQFAAQPGWLFTQNYLAPGNLGPTSPYSLTQAGNNVSAVISVNGLVCDAGLDLTCDVGDDVTKWTGIFSAQYTNTTVGAIIALVSGGGTLDNNTWSGTLEASSVVPEPESLALMGLGLIGLAVTRRRRAVK